MKFIYFILFLFFLSLISSRKIMMRRQCRHGTHYRIVYYGKNNSNSYRRFHKCMCPKLKNCKKIKKCKFGVPFKPIDWDKCQQCVKCRETKCPKLKKVENCAKYEFYMEEGCKAQKCVKCKKLKCKFGVPYKSCSSWGWWRRRSCDFCEKCRKEPCPVLKKRKNCLKYGSRIKDGCEKKYCIKRNCPKQSDLKCKKCEYGFLKYEKKDGCYGCPICKPKPENCPKLTCKQLNCTLGIDTHKDWKGCDLCPYCKCPPWKYEKCKFGESYWARNKDGCDVQICRETECPKVEEPKNCDSLWWSYKDGCKSTPHCWRDPCKRECPKVNCTYGVFVPRDIKTGCKKCEYCEKDPRVKLPDEMDIQLQEIEKIIDMI